MKLNPYKLDLETSFQVIESGENSNFTGQKPSKHNRNQVIKVNIVSCLYRIPPISRDKKGT